ncbi:MAG TPA: recombination mediator RecR [Candidatus Woesebacteria bacterium]|nr:recombination mediator RecR [Candidatus Woesebacteria bacterium]HRS23129.1 recombination mediator RecR [Candidatus Woesebacteria bacterium]HRT40157.1 recombination mediator RecR [Candidatus Woesebacteria bacterium]
MGNYPKAIKDLIEDFEKLPGVGPKSATRLAFCLLNWPETAIIKFAADLKGIKSVKICQECFGVAETNICGICANPRRDKQVICVVERSIDLLAIENMGEFTGVYHVLGGVINPLNHVGPDDLKIKELIDRLNQGVKEVIIATNPTMEGEATALYIKKKIEASGFQIKTSRIGSGLPIGADLEYADLATLSRALTGRKPYE